MNFSNTIALLNKQKSSPTINLETVLELVQTIFSDARYQTGAPVENCPIDDIDRLIGTLSQVTNNVVYIYKKREQDIFASESRYIKTVETAQKACETYRSRIASLDDQINVLSQLKAEQENLLIQNDRKNSSLQELTAKTQQLQAQIDALQDEEPDNEAARLRQEIARKEAQLKNLLQALQDQQLRLSDLNCECTRAQQQIDTVNTDIEKGQAALDSARQNHNQVSAQLETIQQETRQLNEQTEQVQTEISKQQSANRELGTEKSRLETDLQALQAEAVTLRDCLADLEATQAKLDQELSQARSGRDTTSQLHQQYQSALDALREEKAALEQQCLACQEDAAKTREEITASTQSLETAKQIRQALSQQCIDIRTELELLDDSNSSFRQQQLEPLNQLLQQAKDEAECNDQRKQTLSNEIANLKSQAQITVDELFLLERTKISTEKVLADKQAALQTLQQTVDELEAQVKEKSLKCTQLTDRVNELRELLDGRNIEQLEDDLSRTIEALQQKEREAEQCEMLLKARNTELENQLQTVDRLKAELLDLTAKQRELEDEHEKCRSEYEKITSPENRERMASIQNRLTIMKKILSRFGSATPCGDSYSPPQALAADLKKAENSLDALQHSILEYAKARETALNQ